MIELSKSSELYYISVGGKGDNSMDAQLLARYDLAGFIFNLDLFRDVPKVDASDELASTGEIYRRNPSLPERFIAASKPYLYYEVTVSGRRWLLELDSLEAEWLPICDRAKQPIWPLPAYDSATDSCSMINCRCHPRRFRPKLMSFFVNSDLCLSPSYTL